MNIPSYDIIVLDEAQDITKLLFTFFLKFTRDMINNYDGVRHPQIVMYGDARQSIYKFRDSDERYLLQAESLFANTVIGDNIWNKMPLSTSFRVTANMAQFVNTVMIRQKPDLINAVKPAGEPVQYLVGGAFKAITWIFTHIRKLQQKGMPLDDMIVLAPSVKKIGGSNGSPLSKLVKNLGDFGIRVHIANDGPIESKDTFDLAKGKLLFTTFHQSKGIERKVVFVFNFDKTYFEYYNRAREGVVRSVNLCCNEMYVACTRATEQLILVAEPYKGDGLQFVDQVQLDKLVNEGVVVKTHLAGIYNFDNGKPLDGKEKEAEPQEVLVTRLIAWLPEQLAISIMKRLNVQFVSRAANYAIHLPNTVNFGTHKEQVSELNGLAIPALLELKLSATGEVAMLTALKTGLRSDEEVSLFIHTRFNAFRKR
eukprot:gene33947-41870_t